MKKFFSVLAAVVMILTFAASSQAACTQGVPTQAKGMLYGGAFLKAHTYKIAFYTASATWDGTITAYAATNEVSGTNYSAGGFTIADNGSTVPAPTIDTSGTSSYWTFTDLALTTTPITFTAASTCVLIYDSTIANSSCTASKAPWTCCTGSTTGTCTNAVLYVATISSVQPSAGTLTIDFPGATPWLIKMD